MTQRLEAIDLSHHNTVTDWDAICDRFPLVIIKATQGTHYVDPTFHERRLEVMRRGNVCIPYHYAEPWRNNPEDEVDHLLSTLLSSAREIEHGTNAHLLANEYGPMLDLEFTRNHPWNPPGNGRERQAARCAWAQDWHLLAHAETGLRPVQYSGTGFIRHMLGGGHDLPIVADLMVKRYWYHGVHIHRKHSPGVNQCGAWEGTQTDGGPAYTIYQWGKGKAEGVDGRVDLNTLAPGWRARLGVGA